ncbi:MAG: alpha/beta hydrolase [Clostridium sp.]|nr:alpha/beta hydrolase [Clostridium sp.]MCM1444356.1 alpha/beta hydrolase [Candidatus Amulumruptor caecigallinarius]
MIKHIMDIDVNYIRYGNSKGKSVILLHGWGQNIQMMQPIGDNLSSEFDVTIVDLPGFGMSEEPKYVWEVIDYVNCIHKLLGELNIARPIMIGHSFGGKITLLYSSIYDTEKIVLFGSPYTKEVKKVGMKTKVLKSLKKVPGINKLEGFAKKHMGSTDYRQASTMMRNVLVQTVNLDITEEVKKINVPTLLIWGTNDSQVSIELARELEKLIKDCGLIEYEGCTHYAYLERLEQTINVLSSFLRGE